MIVIIPQDIKQAIVYIVYIIIGIIIFLWGSAIKGNTMTEEYKRLDLDSEVINLRRQNKKLKEQNLELMAKNKLYLNTFSGLRHLLRKGE